MFSRLFGEAGSKVARSVPTVQFDAKLVTEDVKTDLKSTIENMDRIPSHFHQHIFHAALNMVERGADLGSFCKATEALDIPGLTKTEIAEIARFLSFRCTSLISANRMLDAGITEAKWLYSGAPCDGSPKQNTLHKAANGKRFAVASGLMISGTPTWPSRERGCKCSMKPIIKGFS